MRPSLVVPRIFSVIAVGGQPARTLPLGSDITYQGMLKQLGAPCSPSVRASFHQPDGPRTINQEGTMS